MSQGIDLTELLALDIIEVEMVAQCRLSDII